MNRKSIHFLKNVVPLYFFFASCYTKFIIHNIKIIGGPLIGICLSISPQADWFGNSMYDLVHPDDVEKVREQLSTTESQNTGRILDLKSKSLLRNMYQEYCYCTKHV